MIKNNIKKQIEEYELQPHKIAFMTHQELNPKMEALIEQKINIKLNMKLKYSFY